MLKKILVERSGNTLIYSALFLLFFLMLFAAVFLFMQHKTTVLYIKQTAANVLDEYTAEQGKKKAASVKNGTVYTTVLDKEEYQNLLAAALAIDSTLTGYRAGNVAFQITNLNLRFSVANQINSSVSFDLLMPVYWINIALPPISGTVTVSSKYNTVPIP